MSNQHRAYKRLLKREAEMLITYPKNEVMFENAVKRIRWGMCSRHYEEGMIRLDLQRAVKELRNERQTI